MRRYLLMLAAMFIGLSIVTGSVAHAMEPLACIDDVTAQSMGHSAGDGDQVPADADNSHPHHHGSCHNHQVVDRPSEPAFAAWAPFSTNIAPVAMVLRLAAAAEPSLRPPIA